MCVTGYCSLRNAFNSSLPPQLANRSYLSTRDGSACCLFQSSFHPPSPDFLRSSVHAGGALKHLFPLLFPSSSVLFYQHLHHTNPTSCFAARDAASQSLPDNLFGAAATLRGGACLSCCHLWDHFITRFAMMNRLKLAHNNLLLSAFECSIKSLLSAALLGIFLPWHPRLGAAEFLQCDSGSPSARRFPVAARCAAPCTMPLQPCPHDPPQRALSWTCRLVQKWARESGGVPNLNLLRKKHISKCCKCP